jgi:hypothetical protein
MPMTKKVSRLFHSILSKMLFTAAFCLGGNKRVIHGMSPGKPLHVLKLSFVQNDDPRILREPWIQARFEVLSQATSTFGRVGLTNWQCTW